MTTLSSAPASSASTSDFMAALPSPGRASWFDDLAASRGFVEGLQPRCDPAQASARKSADPALEEAYKRGEEAGLEAAKAEAAANASAMRELRLRFGQLDKAALEVMEQALASTVLSLCEQVLTPLALDPQLLKQRCQKAAEAIGKGAKDCALHLHPHDITLLDEETQGQWTILPDEGLSRGSVLFQSADGEVSDGPEEWRHAIALAIGAQLPLSQIKAAAS